MSSKVTMQGVVQINRKKYWVNRYAQVLQGGVLQYFKKQGDSSIRGQYNLKKCTIQEQTFQDKSRMIVIQTGTDQVKLMLQRSSDHQKWFNALVQSQQQEQNGLTLNKQNSQSQNKQAGIENENLQSSEISDFQTQQQTRFGSNITNIIPQQINDLNINSSFESRNNRCNFQLDQSLISQIEESEKASLKQKIEQLIYLQFSESKLQLKQSYGNQQQYVQKSLISQPKSMQQKFDSVYHSFGKTQLLAMLSGIVFVLSFMPDFVFYFIILYIAFQFLTQSDQNQEQYIMSKMISNNGINEILYTLKNHKQRQLFHPQISNSQVNEKENILYLQFDQDNKKENIRQVVLKDDQINSCFVLEIEAQNKQILRAFQIQSNDASLKTMITSYSKVKNQAPQIAKEVENVTNQHKFQETSDLSQYLKQNLLQQSRQPQQSFNQIANLDIEEENEQIQPSQLQESQISKVQQQEEVSKSNSETNNQNEVEVKVEVEAVKEETVESTKQFQSEEHKKCFETVQKKAEEIETFAKLDDTWKKIEDKGKDFKVYTKTDEQSGLTIARGETVMNANYKFIYDYLTNLENKKEYDEMFKEGKLIQQFDSECLISYNRMKGKMGVEDRDFCFAQGNFITDEKIITVGTSYTHPECPEVKGATRGNLIIGGWTLIKLEEKKTRAVYVTMADPNGKIPEFVKNWAAKLQGFSVEKVRKIVEKLQ